MKPKGANTDPIIRKAKAKKVLKSLKDNDMNLAEAAKDLGVTTDAVQKQIDRNPFVRSGLQSMLDALEAAGVNDAKAARVVSEAMDAKKEQTNSLTGEVVSSAPDHTIRLKANEQYLKLKRLIGDDDGRADPPSDKKEIHLHFHDMDKRQIQEFITGKLQK